jgi:hypothetical protein
MNFTFAYGRIRFVAIHAEPGVVGHVEVPGQGAPEGTEGPRDDDLRFLGRALEAAARGSARTSAASAPRARLVRKTEERSTTRSRSRSTLRAPSPAA